MVCLRLRDKQLHQPFANEMTSFLRVCGSFASRCGSTFSKISSFQERVVQCGQQASSEVQSVLLEKSKIIKKEDCSYSDILRGDGDCL